MRQYVAENVVTLYSGQVEVTEEQLYDRRRRLTSVSEPDEENLVTCQILDQVQFKAGEQFGYDGEIPKSMARDVSPVEPESVAIAAEPELTREDLVFEVFTSLLEEDPEKERDEFWLNDGRPETRVINERLGDEVDGVSAQERNELWETYVASNTWPEDDEEPAGSDEEG